MAFRASSSETSELAPIHAAQELLDHAVKHGSAPDQRLVPGIQKPHGHQLHAIFFERLNAFADGVGGSIDSHHQRDVGAINIGIEQTDSAAKPGERNREIDGNRGLANASFTGSDGD
jgi:hypothetical protein